MEIKRSASNIPPELREISLNKEAEKKSAAEPAGIISTVDSIQAAKVNPLNDALEAAQQSDANTGEKQLSEGEQKLVSNSHLEDFDVKSLSPFLQDARSRSRDIKNSGPATTPDSPEMARIKENEKKAKDLLTQSTTVHDGSEKDFSSDPLLSGTSLNDALQNEINKRQEDLGDFGGQTTTDTLKDAADPTSRGPKQSKTYGEGMFAKGERWVPQYDEQDKWTSKYGTVWTRGSDGTLVGKGADDSVTVIKDDIVTVTHKDGSWEEYDKNESGITGFFTILKYALDGGKKTDSGGSLESYDPENYVGNLPLQVKELMDYFKQQAMGLKPQTGPGNVDPGPEGDETGGSVDSKTLANRAIKLSGVGTGDNLAGPTGPQSDGGSRSGTVGSTSETIGPASQHGGAVDFGPDSDQVGWTGVTHSEDPGDIKFGPQAPIAQPPDSKKAEDDSTDSASSYRIWESREKSNKV